MMPTGRCSRHIPGIVMLRWVSAHSSPIPFLGLMNAPSLSSAPPWPPLPQDAHCCRMAHPLQGSFLDPDTFLDPFGPRQDLRGH